MKLHTRLLASLATATAVLALGLAVPALAQKAPAERNTRHALIIGIGEYLDQEVPPLKGVKHDLVSARAMAKAMAVPDANIKVISDYEATAERMHACSRDFPSHESEAAAVGFTTLPSKAVAAPRIAESPVALECKLYQTIDISPQRQLIIGQVVWLHSHEGVFDPQTLRVNMDRYFPVGRLYADRYVTTRDQFVAEGSPEYLAAIRSQGRL